MHSLIKQVDFAANTGVVLNDELIVNSTKFEFLNVENAGTAGNLYLYWVKKETINVPEDTIDTLTGVVGNTTIEEGGYANDAAVTADIVNIRAKGEKIVPGEKKKLLYNSVYYQYVLVEEGGAGNTKARVFTERTILR